MSRLDYLLLGYIVYYKVLISQALIVLDTLFKGPTIGTEID